MTEFNDLMKMLEVSDFNSTQVAAQTEEVPQPIFPEEDQSIGSYEILPNLPTDYEPFNIDKFTKELYEKSAVKNQLYRESIQNISAYDISSGCIREIIYKLKFK